MLDKRGGSRLTPTGWALVIFWVLSVLASLGISAVLIWVLVHFIHKYW